MVTAIRAITANISAFIFDTNNPKLSFLCLVFVVASDSLTYCWSKPDRGAFYYEGLKGNHGTYGEYALFVVWRLQIASAPISPSIDAFVLVFPLHLRYRTIGVQWLPRLHYKFLCSNRIARGIFQISHYLEATWTPSTALKHVFISAMVLIFSTWAAMSALCISYEGKCEITQGLYSMTCYVRHGSIIVIKRSL